MKELNEKACKEAVEFLKEHPGKEFSAAEIFENLCEIHEEFDKSQIEQLRPTIREHLQKMAKKHPNIEEIEDKKSPNYAFRSFRWTGEPNGEEVEREKNAKEMVKIFTEGKDRKALITLNERDQNAPKECLKAYLKKYGTICCQVCGFSFEKKYGELGKHGRGIEVHHLKPMPEGERGTDPIRDLVPVCPNCHRMLHRKTPPYSPSELKTIISNQRN